MSRCAVTIHDAGPSFHASVSVRPGSVSAGCFLEPAKAQIPDVMAMDVASMIEHGEVVQRGSTRGFATKAGYSRQDVFLVAEGGKGGQWIGIRDCREHRHPLHGKRGAFGDARLHAEHPR